MNLRKKTREIKSCLAAPTKPFRLEHALFGLRDQPKRPGQTATKKARRVTRRALAFVPQCSATDYNMVCSRAMGVAEGSLSRRSGKAFSATRVSQWREVANRSKVSQPRPVSSVTRP